MLKMIINFYQMQKECMKELQNINGFDITFGSNYTLMSEIPDYAVNLEISNKF